MQCKFVPVTSQVSLEVLRLLFFLFCLFACFILWDSSVAECQTLNQKVAGSSPGRSGSGGRILFFRVSFLC